MGCTSSVPVSVLDEIREIEHAAYPQKKYKINNGKFKKDSYTIYSIKQYN
tara:strand:- start:263 stop:412 length:150 start_codon:yes stop_codon:yes gene_type:complete